MDLIIKTTQDFEKYAKAYPNLFQYMETEIFDAQKGVSKLISSELFTLLLDAYTNDHIDDPDEEELKALLPYVQRCTATMATALYIPTKGIANLGQEGLTQPSGENVKASSGWVADKVVKGYMRSYYAGIEDLLKFLEDNKDDYPEWAESDARTFNRELFVFNAEIFDKCYRIEKSRRIYLVLQQSLRIAEDMVLSEIKQPLFDELKAQLLADNYTVLNKVLIKIIEPACSYLAISFGLTDLSITIDENGVTLFDNASGRDSVDTRADIGETIRDAKQQAAYNEGKRLLKKLKDYLIANALSYPLFTVPESTSSQIDNTDKNVVSI